MKNYISIVLTADGYFCEAPLCGVSEGDLICVPHSMSDKNPKRVIAVTSDYTDGDYKAMIEKYIGYPLPRITEKYTAYPVYWEDEENAELE